MRAVLFRPVRFSRAVLDGGCTLRWSLIQARRPIWLVFNGWAPGNLSWEMGSPLTRPFSARARFKFGNGRLGGVRLAAVILLGMAGGRGESAALSLGADIPALLRKGVPDAVVGQLECRCRIEQFGS